MDSDHRLKIADYGLCEVRPRTMGQRFWSKGYEVRTRSYRPWDYGQPTMDSRLWTADYGQPTMDFEAGVIWR